MLPLQAEQLLARCNGNVGAALNSHFDGSVGGGEHAACSCVVVQSHNLQFISMQECAHVSQTPWQRHLHSSTLVLCPHICSHCQNHLQVGQPLSRRPDPPQAPWLALGLLRRLPSARHRPRPPAAAAASAAASAARGPPAAGRSNSRSAAPSPASGEAAPSLRQCLNRGRAAVHPFTHLYTMPHACGTLECCVLDSEEGRPL